MNADDVIKNVEKILNDYVQPMKKVGGKGHYRHISLGNGLNLAVDVFRSGKMQGHIRVHLYNVSSGQSEKVNVIEKPASVPNCRDSACPKCQKNHGSFPSWYKEKEDSEREYFGFQWHDADYSQDSLRQIKDAVVYLINCSNTLL